jgi:hypothetical protein
VSNIASFPTTKQHTPNNTTAAALLVKIRAAVKAANKTEAAALKANKLLHNAIKISTVVQDKLVSCSKAVGLLLIEAKKLHPAVKDFEAFLKRVNGLKLARAYECMKIAEGRTTDEVVREATRKRVAKHRAAKKPHELIADKYIGEDGGPPVSVTSDVTETPEPAPSIEVANTAPIFVSHDKPETIGTFLEGLGADKFFAALVYAPKLKAEIEARAALKAESDHCHDHEDDLGVIVALAGECRAHLQNPKPANIETVFKKLARIANMCVNGAKVPAAADKKPDLDMGAFSKALCLDEPAQALSLTAGTALTPAAASLALTPTVIGITECPELPTFLQRGHPDCCPVLEQ